MELPKRKRTRMKYFDYSRNGAYFITICTQKRQKILSSIKKNENTQNVGEGLAPPEMELTECGKIAENNIKLINEKYTNAFLIQYVIMPNHIHIVLITVNENGRSKPLPYCDLVAPFHYTLTTKKRAERDTYHKAGFTSRKRKKGVWTICSYSFSHVLPCKV